MFDELLVCGGCTGELKSTDGGWQCSTCSMSYRRVGGVPCLLPHGEAWLSKWRSDLAWLRMRRDGTLDELTRQAERPGLLSSWRRRLEQQRSAAEASMAGIDALLTEALGEPSLQEAETAQTSEGARFDSLHFALRDWAWDTDENNKALEMIRQVVREPLGDMLVLGGGAMRLPYDMHRALGGRKTISLDIDPLLTLIAARVLSGDVLELTESWFGAADASRTRANRTLRAPEPSTDLIPVFGNALAPPFRPASFDTVLAPWFVDLVPPDVREFLEVPMRMLKPGGRFVFYGPLLYPPDRPAACLFSLDELVELFTLAGFEVAEPASAHLLFARTPLSGVGRSEEVHAFSAVWKGKPQQRAGEPPPWLVIPSLPIPEFPDRASFQHEHHGYERMISLIDGTCSVDAVASMLVSQSGSDPATARDAVRWLLSELHPGAKPRE